MLRRAVTLLLLVGVSLAPALVSAPATAAGPTKVTVRASAARVPAASTVRVRGTVSGRSARVAVVLQRRAGDRWVPVRRGRVRGDRGYAFAARVRLGVNRFRVRVPGTSRLRAATSRVVTVRGVRRASSPLRSVRALVLRETNEFRSARGRAPLQAMAALHGVAQRWSVHMARTGELQHNPSYAGQYPAGWNRAAENVASGYGPRAVVDAWIASPGHRANLLGAYTHLGIGMARASDGTLYFTQNFAAYES